MNQSIIGRQRQLTQTHELAKSFGTTTKLAQGLTKERVLIQNDLQKISAGKDQLEALKKMKKVVEPILTAEERASQQNKAEIKGTGFQMTMVCSDKGKEMLEKQRDSRRQRHIEALKECTKFVDQFYDNFSERRNETKESIKIFLSGSDVEIDEIMAGLTDELLLANEISYVNSIWDKVTQHRNARKQEINQLRENFDDLKAYQEKGTSSYLTQLRNDLINIAFLLEPQVDELLVEHREKEEAKYQLEHDENDKFYEETVKADAEKFEDLYQKWKDAVVWFHKLKQEDAIKRFLDRMNSNEFVNPPSRVAIFEEMRQEQMKLFNIRMQLMQELENSRPTILTKDFVQNISNRFNDATDESSIIVEALTEKLVKDMENTNEDIGIAEYDLKDFLIKNDAQLEEGQTFDSIMEKRVQPTIERRMLESKTLLNNSIGYQESFDFKMSDICTNMINFYKAFAEKLDANKEKLKQTEINFQVALAQCGDEHDTIADQEEDRLKQTVEEMQQAIHHVELNQKLQDCFDILDSIIKNYRLYNEDYVKIVNAHPDTMDNFYKSYEADICMIFKMHSESKREEIEALFQKETEERQAALEAEALRKWEADKKLEEQKKAEEDAKKPPGKGKPAPAKKGKDADKPQIDVPKLEVPPIEIYESKMGNNYLIERKIEEIAAKIMLPPVEEKDGEENKQDGDQAENKEAEQPTNPPPAANATPAPKTEKDKDAAAEGEENKEEEEKEPEEPPFKENDYMEKAAMEPPQDPEGNATLHPDLLLAEQKVIEILQAALDKTLIWLVSEKNNYSQKVAREGKELQDKSVEELDENLRTQWPRKGRLEVEIYQERKAQISTHNKKYERQVRTCLEKFNLLQEQYTYVLENIQQDFENFQAQHARLKEQLPNGRNLAELQGMSRREKDANQNFDDQCREYCDTLEDLGSLQMDLLIKQNNDMLNGCVLFANGGNYATAEVEWYRGQMNDINKLVSDCKEERLTKNKEIEEQMNQLKTDPTAEFQGAYGGSIQNLSAKEGLGKTYGQPRRFAQERLRACMTQCEQAQKGVDQLVDRLTNLCQKAFDNHHYTDDFNFNSEKQSLSIEIRITLVSAIRCIQHYAVHMNGFVAEPRVLPRVSYLEDQESVDLTEEELSSDERRKDEELEVLGPIGFKNAKEPYLKFPESIAKIDQTCKDLCTKLYTGENAKYLVGNDKIPEYLSLFLDHMKKQAEEFKINCVRELRTSALKLLDLCQEIPRSVFNYLAFKYSSIIKKQVSEEEGNFDKLREVDNQTKEQHLKMFRPNLENPANKEDTQKLNQKEIDRTTGYKELIDDTQINLLDIEQDQSQNFYVAYLNNVRALIKLFDGLVYREDFIMLPGDEIVEKKHKNIKLLTAAAQNTDLSKRPTRKWPGLGPNIFKVDFSQFEEYKNIGMEGDEAQNRPNSGTVQPAEIAQNEINTEVEVQNTPHHKAIVKQRNDNYTRFQSRFQDSLNHIMTKFDMERKEELRFNSYWEENLKELTVKHI